MPRKKFDQHKFGYNSTDKMNASRHSTTTEDDDEDVDEEFTTTNDNDNEYKSIETFSQVLKLALKLYQDNFRLKKFFNNFKLYLKRFGNSNDDDDNCGLLEHFETNFSNVQNQLFNDHNSIKMILEKLDFFDLGDIDESQTGFEQILFSQSQTLLVKLDHDNLFENKFLKSLLQNCSKLSNVRHSGRITKRTRGQVKRRKNDQETGSDMNKVNRHSFNKNVDDDIIYRCSFCTETFDRLNDLIRHLVRLHDSIFQCFDCKGKFRSRYTFTQHCGSRKCIVQLNKLHENNEHSINNQDYVDKPKFNCGHCPLSFKRSSYLNNHIRGVHFDLLKSEQQSTGKSNELMEAGKESGSRNESTEAPYTCSLCKLNFERSIFLVDHIAAFHTENCCITCNKQFKGRSTLNRHIKESQCGTQSPRRMFTCNFCNFPFKRITHLNQHMLRKHSSNPSLELIFENYNADSGSNNITPGDVVCIKMEDVDNPEDEEYEYEEENDSEDVNKPQTELILCNVCNLNFSDTNDFTVHLESEHLDNEGNFQCVYCSKVFRTRNNMTRHIQESSCYKLSIRRYRCKLCERAFKRNTHLNQHIIRVHNDHTLLMDGNICLEDAENDISGQDVDSMMENYYTDQENKLNSTVSSHKSKESGPETMDQSGILPDGLNSLDSCNQFDSTMADNDGVHCDNLSANTSNNNNNTSNLELVCKWPGCDFNTNNNKELSNHRKLVHLGWNSTTNQYRCTRCEKVFDEQVDCSKHWRVYHFSAKYRCSFGNGSCKFETTNMDYLREHKSRHVKIKCYTCDWENCGKTFVNKSLVEHHVRIVHKNERKHPCVWPGCEQSFKRAINLRHHMATHTGVCNYHCPYEGCQMSFRNPGSLYLHRRRHNAQATHQMFKCDLANCPSKLDPTSQTECPHRTQTPTTTSTASLPGKSTSPTNVPFKICEANLTENNHSRNQEIALHQIQTSSQSIETTLANSIYHCSFTGCGLTFSSDHELKQHLDKAHLWGATFSAQS